MILARIKTGGISADAILTESLRPLISTTGSTSSKFENYPGCARKGFSCVRVLRSFLEGLYLQMNIPNPEPRRRESNPMADSWKPEDKALEAAFENPEEFDVNQSAIEDSRGPIEPKTDGEVDRSKGKGCRSSGGRARPGRPHDYEVQQRGNMAWVYGS
jgi:hypothetical protein